MPMATVLCQCTALCYNYCIVAQGSRSRHRNRQWTTGDSFLSLSQDRTIIHCIVMRSVCHGTTNQRCNHFGGYSNVTTNQRCSHFGGYSNVTTNQRCSHFGGHSNVTTNQRCSHFGGHSNVTISVVATSADIQM